ncbi:tripartite motif-containing protein 16-like protein isoform X1 [Brachyistius frenatus]|uniref:tripartite motif-containing protein 16-like protein isoform X1 n=1 Tax=Brachyistius frenatus TaxID=100188 RepID=UPI0037E85CC7
MSGRHHVSVRRDRLCCPICSSVLRDPVTVPCGHNFCRRCVRDRWDRDRDGGRPCSCPQCGRRFPSRPELVQNSTLSAVVRDTERRHQQLDGSPQVQKKARSSTGTPDGTRCRRHRRPLDVYCCTDERIICDLCASNEHRGHRIGGVEEERRRGEEELKTMRTELKQHLQKQEEKWENLGRMPEQVQEEAGLTKNYCESVIVNVMDSLQRHYRSLSQLIGAQREAAAAQVDASRQRLQVKMEAMKRRDAELDRLAQTDSSVHFLQSWPSVRLLCEEDLLPPPPQDSEDPLLPFQFTKRSVEQLGRKLEELCDKEFASICQTVPAESGEQQESEEESDDEDDVQPRYEASSSPLPGLIGLHRTEQKKEPEAREDFLQYACDVFLDPSTAHEDLVVSEGDRQVMLSPQKCKSPALRYPHRFLHRRQVLCREGLRAERCYYEVEVEGHKAEIALTYRGIDRKSRTKLSAFGGSANSWSLDRSTNYSVSHRADSVQLTKPPRHHRIGVYLSFRAGTLAFYEVADRMTFLYKIEAEFTEPLYPGFWLGDKCCIRICDLRS